MRRETKITIVALLILIIAVPSMLLVWASLTQTFIFSSDLYVTDFVKSGDAYVANATDSGKRTLCFSL